MSKKRIRQIITLIIILIVIAAIVYAFRPQPTLVDIGTVQKGHMMLTIDDEGRTRVKDTYVISAPVNGNLLRVDIEPGDTVVQGETIVARMLPTAPPTLDARQASQAKAAVKAAEAALRSALANLDRVKAEYNLAASSLSRAQKLYEDGAISQSRIDEATAAEEAADAAVENVRAGVSLREAELENAQAALIGIQNAGTSQDSTIEITAPVSGQVLQVLQESASVIAAGTPVLALGNVDNDLEIIVELLSTEAVRVEPGDRVIIENWGGSGTIDAVVEKIEPRAFTKYSALGVEEQRVNTIIRFSNPDQANRSLGHGYRVEARIVVWEDDNATIVPSSALFRKDGEWTAFVVEDGFATLRAVTIDRNNGLQANVIDGLNPGDQVILYPPTELSEGTKVEQR